jgi:hypothetical protein
MKRTILPVLFAMCMSSALHAQASLEIALKHGSKVEQQTRDQLQRLLKAYDLAKWTFTKSILIDEESIPHSHPVLTLSARHVKDDELLLSTFVHEQAHWFLTQNSKATEDAKQELRSMFPKVPIKPPEGASDEESTYLHLIVIYLEYRADRELLGELKARQVMEFWATDHYTWIYKTVLERPRDIGNVAFKHKLVPPVRG